MFACILGVACQFLGAQTSFFWLTDAASPRGLALANSQVAGRTMTEALALNPAGLATPESHGGRDRLLIVGMRWYPAGIMQQSTQLIIPGKSGIVGLEIARMDCGTLNGYDSDGNETDAYSASDLLIRTGLQRNLGPYLSAGLTIGGIHGQLEETSALALLWSLGVQLYSPRLNASIGLVSQNNGRLVDQYVIASTADELPSAYHVGLAKGLKYLPLTIFVSGGVIKDVDVPIIRAGGEFRLAGGARLRLGVDQGKLDYARENTYGDLISGLSLGLGYEPVETDGVRRWRQLLMADWAIKLMGPLGVTSSLAVGLKF